MGQPQQQTVGYTQQSTGYTTTNANGAYNQNLGYAAGNTVYGGQTTYSNVPTDYKLVNQTYTTTTGGYSGLGQSLAQKVVAD